MSDDASCGNCRFFLVSGHEKVCRRFPPLATFIPAAGTGATITAPQTISYFPGMQETGWCGEHRPKGSLGVVHQIGDGMGMK